MAEELGVDRRGNSMGARWGDVDNDGRLDLYVVGPASSAGTRILNRMRGSVHADLMEDLFSMASGNELFLGREDGRLVPGPEGGGGLNAGWAWGSALADIDLDGRLDVFCVNGFVTGDLPQDT